MNHNIYAIYDKVSEIYSQPFFAVNHSTAFRHCRDMISTNRILCTNSNDYFLVSIGCYDDSTGVILADNSPETLASLNEFNTTSES